MKQKDLYLGIDTGGTGVKYVVTDSDGSVLSSGDVPTDPNSITHSMESLGAAVARDVRHVKTIPRRRAASGDSVANCDVWGRSAALGEAGGAVYWTCFQRAGPS